MRLDALRQSVLLLLGLPVASVAACRRDPGPAPPTQEIAIPGIDAAAPIAILDASGAVDDGASGMVIACPADHARERLCGVSANGAYAACPKTANELSRIAIASEQVTDRARLAFDPETTEQYRAYARISRPEPADIVESCCYSRCKPLKVAAQATAPIGATTTRCIERLDRTSGAPAAADDHCPNAIAFDGSTLDDDDDGPMGPGVFSHVMPPTAKDPVPGSKAIPYAASIARCCYRIRRPYPIMKGRLLRVDGRPLVARARRSHAWSLPLAVAHRDAGRAATWRRDAAFEHASVASFARLALQLMALGAPADLVRGAHAAAIDEIAHARLAYGLASAHGQPVGPAALRDRGCEAVSIETLAREAFVDGCIGETVAAADAARTNATCDAEREALAKIASDETRHAELAWQIVAWACARSEAARTAVSEAMNAQRDPARGRGLRAEVLREVVLPCAEALLQNRWS